MTDENKDSTPAEPVEVALDETKASVPVEEVNGGPEEQTKPNGGGR